MGAATHTSQAMYNLDHARGRGHKLFCAQITVTNDETVDTGLDTIEGISGASVEGTDIDSATNRLMIKSVSDGVITWVAAEVDTYTSATDMVGWFMASGSVR